MSIPMPSRRTIVLCGSGACVALCVALGIAGTIDASVSITGGAAFYAAGLSTLNYLAGRERDALEAQRAQQAEDLDMLVEIDEAEWWSGPLMIIGGEFQG